MKNRIVQLDFLKCVFILHVIMIHLVYLGQTYPWLKEFFLLYTTPVFFVISGFLAHVDKPFTEFYQKVKWWLVPYIVMEGLYIILASILPINEHIDRLDILVFLRKPSWQSSYPALVRSLWLTYVMTVFWLTVYRFMPQLFRKGAFVIGKNTLPILLFSPAFTIITKLFVPLFTFDPTVILFTITAVAFTVCGCLLTAKAMDYLRISPYFCGKDHFFCRK